MEVFYYKPNVHTELKVKSVHAENSPWEFYINISLDYYY